jgi:hypothetical protein
VRGKELEDVVVGKRVRDAAFAPLGALGVPHGVEDGLFGGVDRRDEERVEVAVGHRLAGRPTALAGLAPCGREGEEDLAAGVLGDRSGAGQPEAGTASDAGELIGEQRRVAGDDDDAASRRSRARARLGREQAPDRDAVDAQLAALSKFASTTTPTIASSAGTTRLAVPMPPLKPKHIIPVPAPTAPWAMV